MEASGVAAFEQRYVQNGMMDFLIKEKEAGRIRNLGFSFPVSYTHLTLPTKA